MLAVYPQAFDVEQLPFANVARLMAAMPVPVPAILGHSNELGILALEDLGDVTLQAHLGPRPAPSMRRSTARPSHSSPGCSSEARPDVGPLPAVRHRVRRREALVGAAVLRQAFPGGVSRAVLTPAEREALGVELLRIAEELAAEPRVFCHRDYHSRNLMLHAGQLYIIDFQDARMGPDTYDLVSLLRDSYGFQRARGRRADCILPGTAGVGADRRGADMEAALFAAVRSDGAATQPQGARHVRLPDDDPRQPGVHPIHSAHAGLRAHNMERDPRFARLREILLLDELRTPRSR